MKIEDTTTPINQNAQNIYIKEKPKAGNIMTQAIKAYKDEMLTGLTDEEREEINKKIKEYLKEKPVKTDADKQALNSFIEGLLSQYGFKGNIEEAAAGMGATEINANEEKQGEGNNDVASSEHMIAYQKSILDGAAAKTRILE